MLLRILMVCFLLVLSFTPPAMAKTIYVDQTHHNKDSAEKDIFASIGAAIQHIQPDDVLLIKAGTYRESIKLLNDNGKPRQGLTIRGENRDTVIIKGSDVVTGWKRYHNDIYVKRNWLNQPQQVFVDGEPLKQLDGTIFNGYPEDLKNPLYKQF